MTSKRGPFEKWRKIMIAGSLILLFNAVLNAILDGNLSQAVKLMLNIAGYVCLAYGFALNMRGRRGEPQGREEDHP